MDEADAPPRSPPSGRTLSAATSRGKSRPLHVRRWNDDGGEWSESENLWRYPAADKR